MFENHDESDCGRELRKPANETFSLFIMSTKQKSQSPRSINCEAQPTANVLKQHGEIRPVSDEVLDRVARGGSAAVVRLSCL